jgi:hypothetical protein
MREREEIEENASNSGNYVCLQRPMAAHTLCLDHANLIMICAKFQVKAEKSANFRLFEQSFIYEQTI